MVQKILGKIIPEKIRCPTKPLKSTMKITEPPRHLKEPFLIKQEIVEKYLYNINSKKLINK